MHRPKTAHATLFAVALCAALAGAGCSMGVGPLIPAPNERPRVTLTAAPVNEADTSFYAYELHWSGFDPDGRVDHYEYAVDPKGGVVPETTWIRTTRNQETIHFRASQPDSLGGPHATDPHTFVIKAMDNSNQWSPVVSRAFFAYTIAPTVQMTSPVYPNPAPSSFVIYTGPAVRISWEGRDEDAVLHRGPVLYKYKLLSSADADWASIDPFSDPNGARRRFAATNFAGWDSTESDTPFVELKGLEVGRHYLFLVVAIDEAGAYTADWAVGPNLLPFVVAPPAQVAPRIALECPFANYMWPAGGADPTDEREWLKFDVPSSVTFTLHWFAVPSGNYRMAGYRWRLDGDLDGPGWTEWSLQATQATLGPAEPGTQHFLYIQAKDDHGAVSTAVVYFSCIRTPFDHDLLVVDDTRLEPDQLFANGTRRNYTATWPAAAELDTFLYAVGGTPWRGTPSGRGGTTPPGLFSGYSFDTLGTRNVLRCAQAAGVSVKLEVGRPAFAAGERGLALLFGDAEDVAGFFGGGHARLGKAGSDGIDVDAEARPLLRNDAGDADVAHLGGDIVDLAGVAADGRRRKEVHDLAVIADASLLLELALADLAQIRRRRANAVEGAGEVDVDDQVPHLVGHLVAHAIAGQAGVVDQDVEVAKGSDRRLHELVGIGRLGHRADRGDRHQHRHGRHPHPDHRLTYHHGIACDCDRTAKEIICSSVCRSQLLL